MTVEDLERMHNRPSMGQSNSGPPMNMNTRHNGPMPNMGGNGMHKPNHNMGHYQNMGGHGPQMGFRPFGKHSRISFVDNVLITCMYF